MLNSFSANFSGHKGWWVLTNQSNFCYLAPTDTYIVLLALTLAVLLFYL